MTSVGEQNGFEMDLGDGGRVRVASFGDRIISRTLDPVLWVLFALAVLTITVIEGVAREFGGGYDEDEAMKLAIGVSVGLFVTICMYEVFATQAWGRTLGKRLSHLRVIRFDNGLVPDPGQAVARGSVLCASGLIGSVAAAIVGVPLPMLGGIALSLLMLMSSLLDKNGRGWHDKAAGTIVVVAWERDCPEPQGQGQPATKPEPARAETSSASPSGAQQSYGLVSDYYAPRSRDG